MSRRLKRKSLPSRTPWEYERDRLPGEPGVTWEQRMPPEAARLGRILAAMSRNGGGEGG